MSDLIKKDHWDFAKTASAVSIPDFSLVEPEPEEPPLQGDMEEASEDSFFAEEEPVIIEKPEPLTQEQLKELYWEELEQIREDAAVKAYSDALAQKKGELKECIAEVEKRMDELQKEQQEYIEQYSRELKFFSIDIAEKVMLQRIEDDDAALNELVLQTIGKVRNANWLTVEVSERLVSLVEFIQEELKKPQYHDKAEVTPTACPNDTCRVHTEKGTIISTINVQTGNLRAAFAETELDEEKWLE